ncbi:MAG: hypothetical protein AB8C13_00765 [Phycisphaerales bacterium]
MSLTRAQCRSTGLSARDRADLKRIGRYMGFNRKTIRQLINLADSKSSDSQTCKPSGYQLQVLRTIDPPQHTPKKTTQGWPWVVSGVLIWIISIIVAMQMI